MNLTDWTLTELRDAIAAGCCEAVEVVRGHLDRIARHNDGLGRPFSQVFAESALARAAAVDRGEVTGPLAGVPVAVKDVLCTREGQTTCSSRMLAGYRSPFTATCVARLEAAGAIVLGKTAMDEFAMGSSCENCAWGPVRNPWATDRVPGGSSGGSAAAMAADLCAGALGTDTGGSIRQPAALTGIVGFKPTYGRVSRWGLVAFASSLDQVGPMCRSVADAALLYEVMAGRDPHDSTSVDQPVGAVTAELDKPVDNLRIGLARQYLSDSNDPAVAKAVDEAVAVYRDAGATVVDVDLPHTKYGIPVYYIVATAEASSNLARYDGIHYGHRAAEADDLVDLYCRSRGEGFGDEVKRRIMLGTYVLSSGYHDAYYVRALKVRRLIKRDFDQAFTRCDAILCPTTTGPAFKLGDKLDDPLAMYMNDVYTVNANLAGIPGISVPGGFTDSGLPVGVQLLGPAFDDARLLRIAAIYERATRHGWRRPPLGE